MGNDRYVSDFVGLAHDCSDFVKSEVWYQKCFPCSVAVKFKDLPNSVFNDYYQILVAIFVEDIISEADVVVFVCEGHHSFRSLTFGHKGLNYLWWW